MTAMDLIAPAVPVAVLALAAYLWGRFVGRSAVSGARDRIERAVARGGAAAPSPRNMDAASAAMIASDAMLRAAVSRADAHANELKVATEHLNSVNADMLGAIHAIETPASAAAAEDDKDDEIRTEELPAVGDNGDDEGEEDCEGCEDCLVAADDYDTLPVGKVEMTPVASARWYDAGDFHHTQVTLWPSGGGVDINSCINAAAQSLSLSWQEFDVAASLADHVRLQDPTAPKPNVLRAASFCDEEDCPMNPDDDGECPNCGQTAEERAAVWAEIKARGASEPDKETACPASGCPAGGCPNKAPWSDPDLHAE